MLVLAVFAPMVSSADNVIILGMEEEPESFDVHKISGGVGMTIGHLIYDYLIRYGPDGERLPGLAESWEFSEDATTLTFHLRAGVTFHDGSKFDAAAVKYNFDRLMDPATGSPRQRELSNAVVSIETPDNLTVIFNLAKPDVAFIGYYVGEVTNGAIISPTAIEKYGDKIASHPVGTGPFKFVSWELGRRVVLERNEDFWGGAPLPSQIIVRPIPDASTRLVELETGGIHYIYKVEPAQMDFIVNDPDLTLYTKPSTSLYGLWFNQNREPFGDLNVRKAIALAIDVDTIVEVLGGNAVVRSQGPVPVLNLGHNPNIVEPGYNQAEAKRLLSNSGWALGSDGVYEKDGQKLEFTILSGDGHNIQDKQISEAAQDQLKQFGIKVSLRIVEHALFMSEQMSGNFDMVFLGGWFTDNDPARGPMYLYLGDTQYNVFGFVNEDLQAAFTTARSVGDFELRKALAWEAQEIINDAVVAVWFYNANIVAAATSNLKGYEHNGIGFLRLENVYLAD
jgi:peptide/nickel transport system substrate-binding protein